MQYYVGEGDDRHLVDHPPLFACEWEGRKSLLTMAPNFVEELLATSQDVMPGNPGEIAGSYFKPAEGAFTLPSFLIPPRVFLFNPENLRGPDALPYLIVLVDKKFFGIPARYLTPDRFTGCDGLPELAKRMRHERKLEAQRRRDLSGSSSVRGPVPPPQGPPPQGPRPPGRRPPSQGGRPRRPDESGVRRGPPPEGKGKGKAAPGSRRAPRPNESGVRRPPKGRPRP
ncbi:MAG TPA: hypothetical protein DEA08_14120 [Planctomycetes bacterium]|nr:hypothetical protein [Planctomycetota bacterium]